MFLYILFADWEYGWISRGSDEGTYLTNGLMSTRVGIASKSYASGVDCFNADTPQLSTAPSQISLAVDHEIYRS